MATTRLPNLIPPFRYTMVEEDLFRGGFPKPRNYRFLQRLRLKTILSLIPDKATPELQEFCERENIHMLRLTVDRMKEDNIPLSYNKTILALQILIDPENHPLYIHCLDGADVTGLVIACLRKLQMWTLSSALLEFSRNLHTSVITSEESEFVENFKNFQVTIPMTIRPWLWGGEVNFRKHATLRLVFLNSDMMTDEERELKDKEERKERDKENFYKKRKNDLLDNLFESSTPSSRTQRTTNTTTTPATTASTATATTATATASTSTIQSKMYSSSSSPPPSDNNTNSNNNDDNNDDNLPNVIVTDVLEDEVDRPVENGKELTTKDNKEQVQQRDPNQYLVDVDVDVEGVMMDGLDQVQYYNRAAKSGIDVDVEERVNEYEDSRYTLETISRTLEALALEGLD
ncbi:tyrosine phosphatase family-domain-containing protein [Chlamydoabsidia padenii]|nr:tyrosine phosphatase family-domain-containing protein [Chlamydoabsidia padenii]